MKMGIKEFRERLSEITRGTDQIEVTHHGRVVGTFKPSRRDPEKIRVAAEGIRRWQEEMLAKGVNLEAELASVGIAPDGSPIDADERLYGDDRR